MPSSCSMRLLCSAISSLTWARVIGPWEVEREVLALESSLRRPIRERSLASRAPLESSSFLRGRLLAPAGGGRLLLFRASG